MNALTVAVVLLAGLPAADSGQVIKEGKHFRVVCHFEDEHSADIALAIVESVWSQAMDLYGQPNKRGHDLLEVHLYRNAADYHQADQRLTGGQFERNLAFAHYDSKTAHVALQPPCNDAFLKEVGLPDQTKRLIAHEASHLVRYHLFSHYRSHPLWLVDGAAVFLSHASLRAIDMAADLADDPYFGKSVVHVLSLLDGKEHANVLDVLEAGVGHPDLGFYERYALHALLFRFLKDGPSTHAHFQPLLKDICELSDSTRSDGKAFRRIKSRLGSRRLSELPQGFKTYVRSMRPQWDEVFRSLETRGKAWTQIAFPQTNAIAWRRIADKAQAYRLSGKLLFLPAENAQMNVLLGRHSDGFVSVALSREHGIFVFKYDAKAEHWGQLASAPLPKRPDPNQLQFTIRVNKDKLAVSVNEQDRVEIVVDHDMSGPWGLGAQAGSAGQWSDIKWVSTAAD